MEILSCFVITLEINNSKNKIFCFSNLQYKIARFFFKDKFIYKSLILMPEILNETHLGINLNHIKNFNPESS